MFYRGLGEHIRPEVEKPSAKTTIARPLMLFVLLICIAILAAGLTALWLVNLGRLLNPAFIGPLLGAAICLYGVRSISLHPLRIEWNEHAYAHRRTLLSLLGIAALSSILYLCDYWPQPSYGGWRFLWWTFQPMPPAEGGGLWAGVTGYPLREIVKATTFVWARVILAIALPVALPYVVRLIWYRFGVEIVYPSWSDGAVPRGVRWLDPLGLLDIHLADDGDKSEKIAVSAQAMADNEL